jgi:hypothetical protein
LNVRRVLTVLLLGFGLTGCITPTARNPGVSISIGTVQPDCPASAQSRCLILHVQNDGRESVQIPVRSFAKGWMLTEPNFVFQTKRRDEPDSNWQSTTASIGTYLATNTFLTVPASESRDLWLPLPGLVAGDGDRIYRVQIQDRYRHEYLSAPFDAAGNSALER